MNDTNEGNMNVGKLPERMTMRDIASWLKVDYQHIRRMRAGITRNMSLMCRLPEPTEIVGRCPVWNVEDIVKWAMETGRLDPITGEIRRIGNRKPSE